MDGVDTYDVVLFLHIMLAIASFMMAAVLHTALIRTRTARVSAEMKVWPGLIHRLEPGLPIAALALLATGLWMLKISDGEFVLSDGWVLVSVVSLIVGEILGGSLSPKSKAWQAGINALPDDGPIPEEVRPARVMWLVMHMVTGLFFGVVYLMVLKPSTGASIVAVVVAAALGLASAAPFLRSPAGSQTRMSQVARAG